MELGWLETFLAVVDRGGFTAASEQVHRSQSRVSAHIAALERELGMRLIDRNRRPAALTTAGEVFAGHAREIVAGVGSARSAVGALREMDSEALTVLSTPCIASAFLPGVLAELLAEHPGARLTISEQSTHEVEHRFSADGVALAVLPTLDPPLAPGLREDVLWREPLRVVVPLRHELAEAGSPVAPHRLVRHPLVVSGSCRTAEPEVLAMLAARGLAARPRARVDTPQAALGMVRAGVGIGVLNAVAVQQLDASDVCVLDVDDPEMVREVAVYWYDVLLETVLGKSLHRGVLAAPAPPGAVALDGDDARARSRTQSRRQPWSAASPVRRPPRR